MRDEVHIYDSKLFKNSSHKDYIYNRYVLVEKYKERHYWSTGFNGYGRIFVSPGIYTREYDESSLQLNTFDIVSDPATPVFIESFVSLP